jgi:hypothetical protein
MYSTKIGSVTKRFESRFFYKGECVNEQSNHCHRIKRSQEAGQFKKISGNWTNTLGKTYRS